MSSKCGRVFIGIDVVKSGGTQVSKYRYAIAVVCGGNLLKLEEGSIGRLVRVLWEYRPATLAVDNLMELGGSKRNLIKVMKLMPPDTEVVQVTLEGGETRSLKEILAQEGIHTKHKLSPVKTALALAILAEQGRGRKLKVFSDRVKILVSKGRGGVAGGSRTEKYQRHLRAAVARIVRKIREELDRNGFDYDLIIRKSKGGIERAVFTVYSPREKLYGIVEEIKGRDVTVRLRPVINRRILQFTEVRPQGRYVVVGYDPGTEAGLAILDLNMRPLLITSRRELDREDIISLIYRYGIPALIATDKVPEPDMVKKLAAKVNAKLFVPSRSLTTAEKELLVSDYMKRFGVAIRTTHERDALAAAVKAYSAYRDRLSKLIRELERIGVKIEDIDKFKVKVFKGEPLQSIIEEVIDEHLTAGVGEERLGVKAVGRSKERKHLLQEISRLKEKVHELDLERKYLQRRLEESESRVKSLERELDRLLSSPGREERRDWRINLLRQRIENLTNYVNQLERELLQQRELLARIEDILADVIKGRKLLVRVLQPSHVSENLLRELKKGEPVLVLSTTDFTIDTEFINLIKEKELKVILPENLREVASTLVKNLRIPAATVSHYRVIRKSLAIVGKEVLDDLRRAEETIREELAKLEGESSLTEDLLDSIISEYRRSRFSSNVKRDQVDEYTSD